MRKLFYFCAAMLVALAANATVKNIEPGTDKLTAALSSAADGDVIILADGTYNEAGNYIVFDKNVEVKAAENAKPQIDVVNYIKVSGEKTVKIQGLKFNGEAQGSRDQYIRIYAGENNIEVIDCEFDAIKKNIFRCEAGNKFASLKVKNCKFNNSASNVMSLESALCGDIEFDGCEFTWGTAVPIHFMATAHAEKLKVNNCYFHDGKRAAVFFEEPSPAAALCDSVFVTNSTFAKIENTDDYWVSIIDIRNGKSQTKLGYALVDHCTFYDCKTINTDHVAVRIHKSTDATVSNCIFWDPNQKADEDGTKRAATNLYGGDVKNCIAYNYLHGTGGHIHNGATYTACSQADPKFTDAANGDYTLMSGSPAIKAGSDGKDLGDPRWEFFPTVGLGASFNGWNWEGSPFVPASDKKTASINVNLEAGNYELKIVSDGSWLTQKGAEESQYSIHREWNHADEVKLEISEFNMKFEADKAGEYTFTWTYADSALVVTFPDPDYYLKNNWERSDSWTWKKMTQDGANYKLENVVFGGSGVSYYTKAEGDGNWIALDDAKWLGDKLDQLDTANFVFDPEAKTITATLVGEYKEKLPKGFYLVGKIKGVEAWDISDLNAEKMFAKTEVDGEYKLDYNLDNGDAIKVVDVYRDGYKKWYGEGDNYDITEGIAGNVTIYFRPAGNDAWGYYWFDVVKKTDPAAIDNTEVAEKAVKMIENGQLVIIKNGVKYNVLGASVK